MGRSSSSSAVNLRRVELYVRSEEAASDAAESSRAWSRIWLRSRADWREPECDEVRELVFLNVGSAVCLWMGLDCCWGRAV
ncbi:hypothetical protein M758_UG340100 [Ceratodon purpureus]|nr:hypothetical protein M758_UG340100 [Ceratodon purpureus]